MFDIPDRDIGNIDQQMIRRVAGRLYGRYVARTQYEVGVTREDLFHAGIIGWLEAERRLNKEDGGDPGSFYYLNVQGRMLDLIRKQALVRIPGFQYKKLKQLLAVRKDLENQGRVADESLLAEMLGWTVKEVRNLLASVPRVFSADAASCDGEGEREQYYSSFQTFSEKDSPQMTQTLKDEVAALIQHCLDRLESAKQRMILAARYFEDMRLKDLAVGFSCTEQAVHYQEGKALEKMRDCLEKNGWQWDGSEDEF